MDDSKLKASDQPPFGPDTPAGTETVCPPGAAIAALPRTVRSLMQIASPAQRDLEHVARRQRRRVEFGERPEAGRIAVVGVRHR